MCYVCGLRDQKYTYISIPIPIIKSFLIFIVGFGGRNSDFTLTDPVTNLNLAMITVKDYLSGQSQIYCCSNEMMNID